MGRKAEGEAELVPYARCIPSGECLQCPLRGRALVYGPFRSRRRGVSVGINLFPGRKVCSFNCVYCFRGVTEVKTSTPTVDFYGVSAVDLERALETALRSLLEVEGVNAVDFSGSGEPTLHAKFPEFVEVVLATAKKFGLRGGVGVFTNSSTLWSESVVESLLRVDYVEAKLDTVNQYTFEVINEPVEGLKVSSIVEGLRGFRRAFGGTFAIQVMLLKYGSVVNYTEEQAEMLVNALSVIEPDLVHLYTVYRQPRLDNVLRASEESMENYASILKKRGFRVEVYAK